MKLLLIHHRQSTGNVEGRVQNQAGLQLAHLGRRQALALAGRLRPQKWNPAVDVFVADQNRR